MYKSIRKVFFLIFSLFIFTRIAEISVAHAEVVAGITAHRGNSSEFPENTIPAFQSAIKLKVDWAELDVYQTKDGKLVVTHDAKTGRVGDRDMEIANHTYEELKQVDVAHDFRTRNNLSLDKCPRQSIPLLEEVLVLFSNNAETKVSIQPKMDCVKATIDLVKSMNMTAQVGFNDGNLEYMKKVKSLAPDIRVFWDRPKDSNLDEDIKIAKSNRFEALIIHHEGVTTDKIKKVKAAGIEIGAWTVNDPHTMKRFLQMGVQRIYTDEPQILKLLHQDLETVFCEGKYKAHLQGICVDEKGNIFWSWTDQLVKTDAQGKILAQVMAPNHEGDLCLANGQLYVAVNLGQFNQPDNKADSWVIQYDATTLKEIRRIPVPELVYGAGGIAYHKGKFMLVGGLPVGYTDNTIYEYDAQFKFKKAHPIHSGYTLMGIQTIAFVNNFWWFGCYGETPETLQYNLDLTLKARYKMDTSLGIDAAKKGSLLVGNNVKLGVRGHTGFVQVLKVSNQ
jgi:glycerophosphoryl diester phosphodiesterase